MQNHPDSRVVRIGDFAALAGVSVRTLRHYERLGLLGRVVRTDGGQRRYAAADLVRMQQILTLRYLGFPRRRIADILGRPDFDLVGSLLAQRRALRDRMRELERIERTLDALLQRQRSAGEWDWQLVAQATTSVQDSLHERRNAMERYYSPEQLAEFAALETQVPVERRQAVASGWTALLDDVRAAGGIDPADPAVQALLDRWDALTAAVMQSFAGHPQLVETIGEHYRHGRFEGVEGAPQAADFAFIERVRAARSVGEGTPRDAH
jgi:DNA-binding transcriptional MerR regulator